MQYNIFMDYGLIFLGLIITLIAQGYITSSYNKYQKVASKQRLTGFDVAKKILEKNGLGSLHIVETDGHLTDHYDPKRKVIRLSREIYHEESIASIAVAAHECGHALQDKDNYTALKIRNSIVPYVNISSRLGYIAIMIGFLFSIMDLAAAGVILLLSILLFELITLPVEINASKRALQELESLNLIDKEEKQSCKTMLTAAALTYVASLVTTLLQILRYVLILNSRKRR